jgi:hypothetical protein
MDSPDGKQVVGRKGKARQQESGDVIGVWKTDQIDDRDPDYEYQFFREDQVRDRLRPTYVDLRDFSNPKAPPVRHHVSAWTIVHQDNGPEKAAGWRPDEGKQPDTVLTHGGMVCMKIDRKSWDVLQKAQLQRADAYEVLSTRGTKKDFNEEGREQSPSAGKPYVRVEERPLQRI